MISYYSPSFFGMHNYKQYEIIKESLYCHILRSDKTELYVDFIMENEIITFVEILSNVILQHSKTSKGKNNGTFIILKSKKRKQLTLMKKELRKFVIPFSEIKMKSRYYIAEIET